MSKYNIETFKWIYYEIQNYEPIDLSDKLFINNNISLEDCQFLYKKHYNLFNINKIFLNICSCKKPDIEIIKWLASINSDIDYSQRLYKYA